MALHTKQWKVFNCQFHKLSRKIWIFAKDFKHWHIIFHWKVFFTMSMNLRSSPQNKASFVSNKLANLLILKGKACRWSEHFHREQRVPMWWGSWGECVGTLIQLWKWPEAAVQCRKAMAWPHALPASPLSWIGYHGAIASVHGAPFIAVVVDRGKVTAKREREREKAIHGEREIEIRRGRRRQVGLEKGRRRGLRRRLAVKSKEGMEERNGGGKEQRERGSSNICHLSCSLWAF